MKILNNVKCGCGNIPTIKIQGRYFCDECSEDAEMKSKVIIKSTKQDKIKKMKMKYD